MPLTKAAFRTRILRKKNAPSCKLTKSRPPIGPPGCVVRTLQKADGTYHFFRKDGSDYKAKRISGEIEQEDVENEFMLLGELDHNGIARRLPDQDFVTLPVLHQVFTFRITRPFNVFTFTKKADTGAPGIGLILTKTEWESLGYGFNIKNWADGQLLAGNNFFSQITGFNDAGNISLIKTSLELEVLINDRWIKFKKFPVHVAYNRVNFTHDDVFGLTAIQKMAKYIA